MQFERVNAQNSKKIAQIEQFLQQNDLTLDKQVECFVVAYHEQSELVACGGLAGNIIKCVAISEACRGEGVALQLATELLSLAVELNRAHLFIYTKPEYTSLFRQCGFYLIADASPHVVLLENSATRLAKYCQQLATQKVAGARIGAIVMNANPFTLGHRYLIEKALQCCEHLHLFVVGEEASQFSYAERFAMVEQGIADLQNITLHAGSDYLISRATFPNYFLKDKGLTDDCYMEIDLKLFRQHIAPALGITHRFVGSEPSCAVTRAYNQAMRDWLETGKLNAPKIEVMEFERQVVGNRPISASTVRKLLAEKAWAELAQFVPQTTLNYLQNLAQFRPLAAPSLQAKTNLH